MMVKSSRFKMNSEDVNSLLRGLLIAFAGALATYLESLVINLGYWTPVVVALNSIVINTLRLWISGPIDTPK